MRGNVTIRCGSHVGSSGMDNLNHIESFGLVSVNRMWCWLSLFRDLEHGPSISC